MPRVLAALALCLAALVAAPLAGPETWRVATQRDFLKGELEQVAVDEHGRLTLGPSMATVHDAGVPFVWTALADTAGTTYLGTGTDGKVIAVDAQGRGTVFYDAPEVGVHALAPVPGGGLYVGTSPDGRVYKVDSRGAATPFFDPDEKYIWALATDATGQLFVATGDPRGRLYRVSATGAGEPIYTSTATHLVSMVFDAQRRLVVGSESPGRVVRLDADGRPFLLLDTGLQEVRALRRDARGRIVVVAQARRQAAEAGGGETPAPAVPEPARTPVPNVTVSITSMAVVDSGAPAPAAAAPRADGPVTGAIFRIEPDGAAESLWEMRDDTPYDVAPLESGALLVATGHGGKLFRLEGEPLRATLLGRVPGRQAMQFVPRGSGLAIATATSGALVRIDTGHAARGTYVSEVRDAKAVARWGVVTWRAIVPAGAQVEVATRSGNTPTPDEHWSAWSAPYADPEGAPITSPTARYLQWRVTLATGAASPVVTSVAATYLQRNQRPVVSGIVVHPPGVVFQKPFSTGEAEIAGYRAEAAEKRLSNQGQPPPSTGAPALGRRTYQQGLQTIVWKGDDANGDDLRYDLAYRREGDGTWTPLAVGLADAIYVWDTAAVPSGRYVLRITASDAPSQPADLALRGEAETPVVDVDAVAPVVTFTPAASAAGRLAVTVDVRDQLSAIATIEYAVDGGPWQPAYPADGMLDSRRETVTIDVPADQAGRTVVVRAADALHNVGVGDYVLRR